MENTCLQNDTKYQPTYKTKLFSSHSSPPKTAGVQHCMEEDPGLEESAVYAVEGRAGAEAVKVDRRLTVYRSSVAPQLCFGMDAAEMMPGGGEEEGGAGGGADASPAKSPGKKSKGEKSPAGEKKAEKKKKKKRRAEEEEEEPKSDKKKKEKK